MRETRCSFFLLVVVLVFAASPRVAADDTQLWSAVAMTGKTDHDRLLLWFDGHARFSDDAGRLGTSIIRPALGWRVSDRLKLWGGYARVTSHPGENIDEDRIWQQATYPMGTVLPNPAGAAVSRQRQRHRGTNTAVLSLGAKIPGLRFLLCVVERNLCGAE